MTGECLSDERTRPASVQGRNEPKSKMNKHYEQTKHTKSLTVVETSFGILLKSNSNREPQNITLQLNYQYYLKKNKILHFLCAERQIVGFHYRESTRKYYQAIQAGVKIRLQLYRYVSKTHMQRSARTRRYMRLQSTYQLFRVRWKRLNESQKSELGHENNNFVCIRHHESENKVSPLGILYNSSAIADFGLSMVSVQQTIVSRVKYLNICIKRVK